MRADAAFDRRDWLYAAAAALLTCAVYLPALTTWFVSDDFLILGQIRALGGLAHPLAYFHAGFFDQYYRPLVLLSEAVDWRVWGTQAWGFHLTNVLWHAINAAIVYALARRFMDAPGALASAVLFGWHPANHEAVYWISARFDLMATAFTLLSLVALTRDGARAYALGAASFALALLSKESALALPMMAAAYDVLVRRRNWFDTTRRLIPLLALMGVYAVVRTAGAGVSPVGDARRLTKLGMVVVALALLILIAWLRRPRTGQDMATTMRDRRPRNLRTGAMAAGAATVLVVLGLALGLGLASSAITTVLEAKLAFVGYVVFYLVSPVIFPLPPPPDMWPAAYWAGGMAAAILAAACGLAAFRWLNTRPAAAYLAAFIVASLIPVSSMTGGTRYLYLASAGTAMLLALVWRSAAAAGVWRRRTAGIIATVLALSATQMAMAAAAWRWSSTMTRDGLALIAGGMEPCGTRDVILLTMSVDGRGVLDNLHGNSLTSTGQCSWHAFHAVLRVEHDDARVEVVRGADGAIDIRVPDYSGNIQASADLSNFQTIPRDAVAAFDTPIGHLDTQPDGRAQRFHLRLNAQARGAPVYYYSEGRLHALD